MQVLESEQFAKPPTHIAIIMDGNGRWASARGLPRVAGHQRGAEAVRVVVESCRDLGISYLTLYAFSSENWKRPPSEVDDLMALLRHYLRREISRASRQQRSCPLHRQSSSASARYQFSDR